MFDTHRNNTVGCAEQLQDLEASLTGLASKGIRDSTVMGPGLRTRVSLIHLK